MEPGDSRTSRHIEKGYTYAQGDTDVIINYVIVKFAKTVTLKILNETYWEVNLNVPPEKLPSFLWQKEGS